MRNAFNSLKNALPPVFSRSVSITSLGATAGVIAVLMLLSIYALLLWSNASKDQAMRWVTHTLEVENGLGEIMTSLISAEARQRGYLLTGDTADLASYKSVVSRLKSQIDHVGRLTRDNSRQQRRIDLLRPLVEEKLSELNQTIDLKRAGHDQAAISIVLSDQGKIAMDRIRQIIQKMLAEENRLLGTRKQELEDVAVISQFGQLFLAFALFLFGSFLYLWFRRLSVAKTAVETELNTSEQRLLALVQSQRDIITRFTPDGTLDFVNKAYENFHGVVAEDVIGRSIFEDAPDEAHDGMRAMFAQLTPENPSITNENINVSASGEEMYFEWLNYANFDRYGNVLEILSVGRDISERNKAEEQLQHYVEEIEHSRQLIESEASKQVELAEDLAIARDQADAANKSKSEFLASMSHEIRTPMTGVLGFADLLLEENLSDGSREKVFKIKDSTRALLRIINDILDMSKLEAGKVELEYLDFHLPSLIEDVSGLFSEKRASGRAKTVDLNTELADDFPVGINLDPTRLRQVLINLVGNAMKFTDSGSVTIHGSLVETDPSVPKLRFAIQDTGIGIKPEVLGELFSEFTQADASITRKFEGTGLGLSICKKLVTLMDGEIGVESRYGEGSTFWFELPYVAATSPVEKPGEKTKVVSSYSAARQLHILAVDDNSLNQQIIAAILDGFGHSQEVAENGMQAVEMHKSGHFDLILMDVRMPVMSGPDATRLIRKMDGDKGNVPIIALTADAMEEHKKDYFEAGMDGVATKPIDRPALASIINEVLGEEVNVPQTADTAVPPADEVYDEEQAQENEAAVDDFLRQIGVAND